MVENQNNQAESSTSRSQPKSKWRWERERESERAREREIINPLIILIDYYDLNVVELLAREQFYRWAQARPNSPLPPELNRQIEEHILTMLNFPQKIINGTAIWYAIDEFIKFNRVAKSEEEQANSQKRRKIYLDELGNLKAAKEREFSKFGDIIFDYNFTIMRETRKDEILRWVESWDCLILMKASHLKNDDKLYSKELWDELYKQYKEVEFLQEIVTNFKTHIREEDTPPRPQPQEPQQPTQTNQPVNPPPPPPQQPQPPRRAFYQTTAGKATIGTGATIGVGALYTGIALGVGFFKIKGAIALGTTTAKLTLSACFWAGAAPAVGITIGILSVVAVIGVVGYGIYRWNQSPAKKAFDTQREFAQSNGQRAREFVANSCPQNWTPSAKETAAQVAEFTGKWGTHLTIIAIVCFIIGLLKRTFNLLLDKRRGKAVQIF